MKHPEIIAHRGASVDAPENTLTAFALGLAQKADGIELDIYLTKDGRIVVMHDADMRRCAGIEGKIADQTFAELRKLDVGRWKGESFANLRIPSLEEVLALLPPGKEALIEIKCGPEVVAPLWDEVQKSKVPLQQIHLHGFNFETICLMKKKAPNVRAHWLVGDTECDLESLVNQVVSAGLDGLNPSWKCKITSGFMEQMHQADLKAYVWTVNSTETAADLVGLGVDGLITDIPAVIRTHLGAIHPQSR